MKTRVKHIPLALAQSGMTLAEVVRDAQGRILLMADVVLSDNLLARLQRYQTVTIAVTELDTRTEEELVVLREETCQRINQLFADIAQSSELEQLRQLILDYRLEPIS